MRGLSRQAAEGGQKQREHGRPVVGAPDQDVPMGVPMLDAGQSRRAIRSAPSRSRCDFRPLTVYVSQVCHIQFWPLSQSDEHGYVRLPTLSDIRVNCIMASVLADDSSGDCRNLGEADARDKEVSERKRIRNYGGSLAHTQTAPVQKSRGHSEPPLVRHSSWL